MNKTVTKTKSKKIKPQIKLKTQTYIASVKITKQNVCVNLPRNTIKYLNIPISKKSFLFWVPINGTIQLSGNQPQLAIPLVSNITSMFNNSNNI